VSFTIVTIGGLTVAPYFAYPNLTSGHDRSYFTEPSIFWLFILMGSLWVGIIGYLYYEVVTKTLAVTIDDAEKSICFNYPLKFKKRKYFFEEITGFRFSSIYTKACYFKTLIVKTTDGKRYTISELQLSNFKEIETFFLANFNLAKGADFEILENTEKKQELQENTKFEVEQAKSYRLSCYFHIATIFLIILIDRVIANPEREMGWIGYGICAGIFVILVVKIIEANKTIKKHS